MVDFCVSGSPSCLRWALVCSALTFCHTVQSQVVDSDSLVEISHESLWDSIEITGNDSFEDKSIKHGLFSQPKFLTASHRFGEQKDLPHVIRELLTKGYRRQGFPDISVDIKRTRENSQTQWLIVVSEGRRVRCDRVSAVGTKQINLERLTKRLTEPFLPSDAIPTFTYVNGATNTRWVDDNGSPTELESAIWDSEQGVPFDGELSIHREVARAFEDLGYSNATTLVRFAIDKSGTKGTLVVDVIDEGQHDIAAQIRITGLKNNSRNKLLQFLSITENDLIDREKIQDISRRLWESGRFEKQEVTFDAKTQTLAIELAEFPELPSVDQALSDEAEVLLKMARWLGGIHERRIDVRYDFLVGEVLGLAIIGDQGVFCKLSQSCVDGSTDELTLIISKEELLLDHSQLPAKVFVPSPSVTGHAAIKTGFYSDPDPDEFLKGRLTFSGALSTKKDASPVSIVFFSSPSNWLPLAYKQSAQSERTGSELVLVHGRERMHVDVESGQVNQWVLEHETIRFAPGMYAAARDATLSELATKPTVDITSRPVSSMVQYVLAESVVGMINRGVDSSEQPIINPRLASVFRKLAASGVLESVDTALAWREQDSDGRSEAFAIPADFNQKKSMRGIAAELIARAVLIHANKVFDEGSWPLILLREVALLQLDGTEHTTRVIKSLLADKRTGPMGVTAILFLMRWAGASTKAISDEALKRLNPQLFANDFELLTRGASAQAISRIRKCIQSFTADEVDALAKLINNENWSHAIRAIHDNPTPASDRSSEAECWYNIFHDPLTAWLKKHQGSK